MRVAPRIDCFDRWMVVRFGEPYCCASWAVVNGGPMVLADSVAWLFLEMDEIASCDDVPAWFRSRMSAAGHGGAVGLLTSRRLHQYVEAGDADCHVVATVGLSNALAAGDEAPQAVPRTAGTINILCTVPDALTVEASLEAMALVSEARTAAMLEFGVPSIVSGEPSTGTGTDCIVVAHPPVGDAVHYCGKHTAVGARIGRCVRAAVRRGVAEWLEEMGR